MLNETAPGVTNEVKTGPLDSRTVLLPARIMEGPKAERSAEVLLRNKWSKLANYFDLRRAARRHTPGKRVTATGGMPTVHRILGSTTYRRAAIRALKFPALGVIQGDVLEAWIGNLLTPLTLWVLDLPASESNHHSYPCGLLDHAFEVALAAMTEISSKMGPRHRVGDLSRGAYAQALRLSLALGCLHDIGKLFSVEVKGYKTGEVWDPLREPLAYFKARNEFSILQPTSIRFIKGRGLSGHEDKGRKLLPRVVHPRIWKQMGPDIANAYGAYADRYVWPPVAHPAHLDFIADCVRRADGISTAKSRTKGAKRGQYLLELCAKAKEEVA